MSRIIAGRLRTLERSHIRGGDLFTVSAIPADSDATAGHDDELRVLTEEEWEGQYCEAPDITPQS